jgi:hypothetical protein
MPEKSAGVEILAPKVLRDGATFSTPPQPFNASDVVIAACNSGKEAPTQPCQVSVELSEDDVVWVPGSSGRKQFGPIEAKTYLASFHLGDFAEQGAWKSYRLTFGSLVGSHVFVAASTGAAPTMPTPEEQDDMLAEDRGEPKAKKKDHEKDEPHHQTGHAAKK